jgi:hemerythrin-like metal-binding protein
MSLITWNETLSVGVGRIDRQHKNLVGLLNALHNAMEAGKGKEILGEVLNELVDYTVYHFMTEEELFQKYRYPQYEKHKKEHEDLKKRVRELKDNFNKGAVVISIEVMHFLREWLKEHILESDKEAGIFLIACGAWKDIEGQARGAFPEITGVWKDAEGHAHSSSPEISVENISAIRRAEVLYARLVAVQTEMEHKNKELDEAKRAADAATKAKSEFIAFMSHEIRTPIHAVIGMTDIMLETELKPDQREALAVIRNAAESLAVLLTDILDLQKIEAEQLDLEIADFDLRKLLEAAGRIFAIPSRKMLALESYVSPDIPAYLRGDALRLRQILTNLIGNAIKFTDRGIIRIEVKLLEKKDDSVNLLFKVSDMGVGIPKDKIGIIFERFTQADSSLSRKYGGAGLGLSICKKLVELMGGRIWVESEEGKGSIFYFNAPFYLSDKNNADIPDKTNVLDILIIDDNPVNRRVASKILEQAGHKVTTAESGREAINILGQRTFDLALLDIQMPDMDGFDVARTITDPRSPVLRHDMPIIAVTGHTSRECRTMCANAGINTCLTKPFSKEDLLRMVNGPVRSFSFTASDNPAPKEPAAGLSVINKSLLYGRYDNDENLIVGIIKSFVKNNIPEKISAIRAAIEAGDAQKVFRDAHSMKGSAGAIEAELLREAAFALESLAEKQDLEGALKAYEIMEREYFKTIGFIKREWFKEA